MTMQRDEIERTLTEAIENHRTLEATWNDGTIKVFEPATIEHNDATANTLTVSCTSVAEQGSAPTNYATPVSIELNADKLTSLTPAS